MRLTSSRFAPLLLLAMAFIVVTGGTVSAQSHAPGASLIPTPETRDTALPYSPGLALTAPIVATAVSVGLTSFAASEDSDTAAVVGLIGLAVGPSVGHIYTRDWTGALVGTGLRTGGALTMLWGVAMSINTDSDKGVPLMIAGGAAAIGGTLYSIVDAPYSAMRANEKQHSLRIVPAPVQGPLQTTGWGANLGMTF